MHVQQKDARRTQNVQRAVKEIMLAHVYPRLDVEVSKKMNHLLKAPFCVHPKTGKASLQSTSSVPKAHSLTITEQLS